MPQTREWGRRFGGGASKLAFELLRNSAAAGTGRRSGLEWTRPLVGGALTSAFELLRTCASRLAFELLRNSVAVAAVAGRKSRPARRFGFTVRSAARP